MKGIQKIKGFFQLIRYPNLIFIALTQSLFYYRIIVPSFTINGQPRQLLKETDFILLLVSSLLIAAAGFASRLPWLIFTLHAGVITDRFDRRKLIIAMDTIRGVLTLIVGAIVLLNKDSLPSLNDLSSITDLETNWPLYITLVITAFLFG